MPIEAGNDAGLSNTNSWPWGVVRMFWLAVVAMGIPATLMAIGMTLVRLINGCQWNEGSGARGCALLFMDLNWLVDSLLVVGFIWVLIGTGVWVFIAFPVWFVLFVLK